MNCLINKGLLLIISLLLVLLTVLPLAVACEPSAPLRVQNRTDLTLSISVNHTTGNYYMGDVTSGEEIKNSHPLIGRFGAFPIEARDAQGNLVYSNEYTLRQLEEELHWKVVIPPLEDK